MKWKKESLLFTLLLPSLSLPLLCLLLPMHHLPLPLLALTPLLAFSLLKTLKSAKLTTTAKLAKLTKMAKLAKMEKLAELVKLALTCQKGYYHLPFQLLSFQVDDKVVSTFFPNFPFFYDTSFLKIHTGQIDPSISFFFMPKCRKISKLP